MLSIEESAQELVFLRLFLQPQNMDCFRGIRFPDPADENKETATFS